MSKWLGNVSVTLKLAISFGLVLLLTLLLAITGWDGIGRLIERASGSSRSMRSTTCSMT